MVKELKYLNTADLRSPYAVIELFPERNVTV